MQDDEDEVLGVDKESKLAVSGQEELKAVELPAAFKWSVLAQVALQERVSLELTTWLERRHLRISMLWADAVNKRVS